MYLIRETGFLSRPNQRIFLITVQRQGRRVSYTADPERAMQFPTRRLVDNFREKYPHIGGRVVLLASELKRTAQ